MKLIINYDLMDKVNSANGVINYKKIILKHMRRNAATFGMLTGMDILGNREDGINWGINSAICLGFIAVHAGVEIFFEHKFRSRNEVLAYLKLIELSIQLNNFNIATDPELLKKSELVETEYKFTHENSKPIIQQNRYILVPAYDGLGDIKRTSILQEHEMGSNEYVLSIGSPSKKFKLAYAHS